MLILQKSSVSVAEAEQMRDILFMFFPEYNSKTYEQQASKINEEFNRNDITGNLLFKIDEPSLEEDILDVMLNSKLCNYG
jgi:hypothetical protein